MDIYFIDGLIDSTSYISKEELDRYIYDNNIKMNNNNFKLFDENTWLYKELIMKIVEYEDKYLEDVKDLLVELEEYIISIDKDNLDVLYPDYRDKMAIIDLDKVKNNNGKCFVALENNKVVGVIMGIVSKYDEYDYLDYKCPKKGEIIELIVTKKVRSNGIGHQLIIKMEEYFKSIGCEYVAIDVFAYNEYAINFYNKHGYHTRMLTDIKKL